MSCYSYHLPPHQLCFLDAGLLVTLSSKESCCPWSSSRPCGGCRLSNTTTSSTSLTDTNSPSRWLSLEMTKCTHKSAPQVFGALVAGMTSEGGGAVAFPVMTLALSIQVLSLYQYLILHLPGPVSLFHPMFPKFNFPFISTFLSS